MRTAILVSAAIAIGLWPEFAAAAQPKSPAVRPLTLSLPPCAKIRRLQPRAPCMVDRTDPFAARERADTGQRYLVSSLRDPRLSDADDDAEVRLRWLKVTASMRF